MTGMTRARLLEDLIDELVSGVIGASPSNAVAGVGIRPTSVEFSLPIEARVTGDPKHPVVRADVPQTRTRTPFNLPIGRLAIRLTTEVTR
jgi:hypothetical protein